MTPTPATVRAYRTMARIRAEDARHRWEAGRRRDARRNGYHGPLTREELARNAAR
jgi:hypothetical protein